MQLTEKSFYALSMSLTMEKTGRELSEVLPSSSMDPKHDLRYHESQFDVKKF